MASTLSFSLIKPVLASSTTRATWYPHVVAQGSTIEYSPTEISTADSSFLPLLSRQAAGGGKLNIHGGAVEMQIPAARTRLLPQLTRASTLIITNRPYRAISLYFSSSSEETFV